MGLDILDPPKPPPVASRPKTGFDATGKITPGSGHAVTGELIYTDGPFSTAEPGRTIDPDNPWKIHFPALTPGTLSTGLCRLHVDCDCGCGASDGTDLNISFTVTGGRESGKIKTVLDLPGGILITAGTVEPANHDVYAKIVTKDLENILGRRVLLFKNQWSIIFTCVPKGKHTMKLKSAATGKVLDTKKVTVE